MLKLGKSQYLNSTRYEKRSTNLNAPFFYKMYNFFSISKNTIKVQKFHFLNKII